LNLFLLSQLTAELGLQVRSPVRRAESAHRIQKISITLRSDFRQCAVDQLRRQRHTYVFFQPVYGCGSTVDGCFPGVQPGGTTRWVRQPEWTDQEACWSLKVGSDSLNTGPGADLDVTRIRFRHTTRKQRCTLIPLTTDQRDLLPGQSQPAEQAVVRDTARQYGCIQVKDIQQLLIPLPACQTPQQRTLGMAWIDTDGIAVQQIGKQVAGDRADHHRSEEHTSELQSRENLVCRLLL